MTKQAVRSVLAASAILLATAASAGAEPLAAAHLKDTLARAERLEQLHALIVAHDGRTAIERTFRGPSLDTPVNVKSVAKVIVSALVGAAIDRGVLKSVDQRIVPLLGDAVPKDADPRLAQLTIGHLLSMQAGLERTSGANYGRWVTSQNWVRHVLSRPFVDEPGGAMLYSTGNSHLLSAILTRMSGRSTLALARDWLGDPLGIAIPAWQRDPQGIYMGGNEMALSPRALLAFGEMYRNGGVHRGARVLPESWIRESWMARTASRFTGDGHGYGWFITDARGHNLYYARGYGGQILFVAPSLALTVVMTSDSTEPARSGGHFADLMRLMTEGIVPAAVAASR